MSDFEEQRSRYESRASFSPHIEGLSEGLSEARGDSDEEDVPHPPQKIDPNLLSRSHFYFGKTLGEGSYARVVHAKMKVENSPEFAIKIMEKSFIQKEKKVKFVLMEKEILSIVSHPFIIKLYYTFQDSEYLYMCMDMASGGELLGLIRKSLRLNESRGVRETACDVATTRFYLGEVTEALEYLHERNIYHMDLKPENIFLTAKGHVKIGDFGTALKDVDEESLSSIFVGTAEYVSPEVLNEDGRITSACDLWALGCIAFQMLCGRTPFQADTEYLIFQTINGHLDGTQPIVFPASITASGRSLVEALLAAEPSQRLGAGAEGSGYSYQDLKAHHFFEGLGWGTLHETTPPFVPNPADLPDSEQMQDGALDDWLLEGEATPIIRELKASDIGAGRLSADSSFNDPLEEVSLDMSPSSKTKWFPFLLPREKQVFTSLVSKRVGLFSKRRQLILTDAPRLIYVDPETMELKGEIPWTHDYPVKIILVSNSAFDVWCPKSRRNYHFTDCEGAGSQMWADLVGAMLDKQKEEA